MITRGIGSNGIPNAMQSIMILVDAHTVSSEEKNAISMAIHGLIATNPMFTDCEANVGGDKDGDQSVIWSMMILYDLVETYKDNKSPYNMISELTDVLKGFKNTTFTLHIAQPWGDTYKEYVGPDKEKRELVATIDKYASGLHELCGHVEYGDQTALASQLKIWYDDSLAEESLKALEFIAKTLGVTFTQQIFPDQISNEGDDLI